jgi:acetate kinase
LLGEQFTQLFSLAVLVAGVPGDQRADHGLQIGENDVAARAAVATQCQWLGGGLDSTRNVAGTGRISSDNSAVSGWVFRTDEERMMARHTCAVLVSLPGQGSFVSGRW